MDKKSELTFEQALGQLERIVSEIESAKVPLEESIDKYAEGIKLVKQCRGILDKAEKKIQLLAASGDQSLSVSGELGESADPQDA